MSAVEKGAGSTVVLILALDTSSAAGSAALLRDQDVLERAGDPSRTHGQRLPSELMALLDQGHTALRDVDRFAVCVGPGSFTGLRVGIATIQGLALANSRLVAPVSAFEAIAEQAGGSSVVAVWIDAHRGEVFATLLAPDGRVLEPPTSFGPRQTLERWKPSLERLPTLRFAGDGAVRYRDEILARLGERAHVDDMAPPLAGTIARIAAAHPHRAVQPHALVPLYVRRPDAELARAARGGKGA